MLKAISKRHAATEFHVYLKFILTLYPFLWTCSCNKQNLWVSGIKEDHNRFDPEIHLMQRSQIFSTLPSSKSLLRSAKLTQGVAATYGSMVPQGGKGSKITLSSISRLSKGSVGERFRLSVGERFKLYRLTKLRPVVSSLV